MFFRKKKTENLKDVLAQLDDLKKENDKIKKELDHLKVENKLNIQKIGIVRYNPFGNMGSDQSFSIVVLDGNNNGVAISSLFTNEGNRVYAKPIKDGKSEYTLSQEEKEAIAKAIGI